MQHKLLSTKTAKYTKKLSVIVRAVTPRKEDSDFKRKKWTSRDLGLVFELRSILSLSCDLIDHVSGRKPSSRLTYSKLLSRTIVSSMLRLEKSVRDGQFSASKFQVVTF